MKSNPLDPGRAQWCCSARRIEVWRKAACLDDPNPDVYADQNFNDAGREYAMFR